MGQERKDYVIDALGGHASEATVGAGVVASSTTGGGGRRRGGNDEKCGGETGAIQSDNMIEVWRRRRLDRVVVDVLEKIFYRCVKMYSSTMC